MPYIKEWMRLRLRRKKDQRPVDTGELTYVIYKTGIDYLNDKRDRGFAVRGEVILAMECAKLEFYRRHVAPYEDEKIRENGDVE